MFLKKSTRAFALAHLNIVAGWFIIIIPTIGEVEETIFVSALSCESPENERSSLKTSIWWMKVGDVFPPTILGK